MQERDQECVNSGQDNRECVQGDQTVGKDESLCLMSDEYNS